MKSKVVKSIAIIICLAIASGGVFGVYSLAVNLGKTTLTIDTSKRFQTIEGFGASSAWVYQELGLQEDVLKNSAMEMLYGESGLRLNTFRYNVGAGGAEVDSYNDVNRGAESFFVADENFNGDYSVFADADNYDFDSRDQATLDMFERALATGNIQKIVFFANSPHYLMTKNGKTHGEVIYDNNLKEECYEAFAQYLLVIVNHLYDNIVRKYDKNNDIEILISPVNEPQWKWGGADASQEGCHFDPKPLAKFYDVFYNNLKAFNNAHGKRFVMDIFESGNYKLILSEGTKFNEYMREFEKYGFFEDVTHISLHSYGANSSVFYKETFADYMSKFYPNISISMSEYCTMEEGVDESINMGLRCGKVMMRDLTMLNVTDWSYWLSVAKGGYEDGLVYWTQNGDGITNLDVTKRYYVFGHFSRYIPKGSVRVSSKYSDVLAINGVECAAFKNPDDSITIVILNDSDNSRRIALKGLKGYSCVQEITTGSDVKWKTREYALGDSVKVAAKSMTTLVLTR